MTGLYEKLSKKSAFVPKRSVRVGTKLMCDDGFTCMPAGAVRKVLKNKDGELYIRCAGMTFARSGSAIARHKKKRAKEQHCLCGQLNARGTHYVGFWIVS